jgi:hypothetical protein
LLSKSDHPASLTHAWLQVRNTLSLPGDSCGQLLRSPPPCTCQVQLCPHIRQKIHSCCCLQLSLHLPQVRPKKESASVLREPPAGGDRLSGSIPGESSSWVPHQFPLWRRPPGTRVCFPFAAGQPLGLPKAALTINVRCVHPICSCNQCIFLAGKSIIICSTLLQT